jgi:FtsP/CotA-like multicopper oxidase with cupredoxin domain
MGKMDLKFAALLTARREKEAVSVPTASRRAEPACHGVVTYVAKHSRDEHFMGMIARFVLMVSFTLSMGAFALAIARDGDAQGTPDACPRPSGGAVPEPRELRSAQGRLELTLNIENSREPDGGLRYCYRLDDGSESPTLRMKPGDWLILRLRNRLRDLEGEGIAAQAPGHAHQQKSVDPCRSGAMTLVSTNLHFHGLTVPAVCHQDEVLRTSVSPGDGPFEYRFRIPLDEPPGLYWYHPHIHGFSARQVSGGASGALIIEGIEQAIPEVGGLPERVLIIRDQNLVHPDAAPASLDPATTPFVDHDGDAANTGTGFGRPARDLSVNYVPVAYPDYAPATIAMKPGERQLWRVVNASSVTYLNLSMIWTRGHWRREQFMGLVAVDGVPLNAGGSPQRSFQWRDRILVPPGARVELMVNAPLEGTSAQLVTRYVDTGPAGENDPNRPLIAIETRPDAPEPAANVPASAALRAAPRRAWIGSLTPARTRTLIFSEEPVDPADPNGAMRFYLTVKGQTPKPFDPASTTPNLVVHQGDVEDWIIENHSSELHAFHIHQIHFEIIDWLGIAVNEPFLRDTINVPYWTAKMDHYPSIKLRMDFRDPATVGTFPYHCHLLDHEDAGMMGTIRVEPK